MSSAEVVVSAVVVEVNAAGGSREGSRVVSGAVHQPGGVQQMPELLDQNAAYFSGNTRSAVQQRGELLDQISESGAIVNSQALTEVRSEPRSAENRVLPAETRDQRATVLGIGAVAPLGVARRGRPPVLTPALVEQLCMLISIGFTRKQAAAYLGCATSTIANAIDREPSLGEELVRAEQIADLQPELTVMAEARKNWKAAAWYLEFKKRNPRPLSAAEKEERHRENLEDGRRLAAEQNNFFRAALSEPIAPPPRVEEFPPVPKKVRQPRRGR